MDDVADAIKLELWIDDEVVEEDIELELVCEDDVIEERNEFDLVCEDVAIEREAGDVEAAEFDWVLMNDRSPVLEATVSVCPFKTTVEPLAVIIVPPTTTTVAPFVAVE